MSPIDARLADALMAKTKLLAEDWRAHAKEHSLEVQLPFLQRTPRPTSRSFRSASARIATTTCEEIGHAIADVIKTETEPVGILASSDLNHYEDQGETLRKDQSAIEQVLARNPSELWRVVDEYDVSMCGFIPDDDDARRGERSSGRRARGSSNTRRPAT